jgi:cob(I)alamin adenosyltransferase
MRIYTRKGDDGQTEILGGGRVPKDAARPEVCGALDELNAVLGLAQAHGLAEGESVDLDRVVERVQGEVLQVGAELADPDPEARGLRTIGPQHTRALEEAIDRFDAALVPLDGFILPGGTRAAGLLHLARTVCRRAERRLVTLSRTGPEPISPELLAYLNRLGDLLFVLARAANARAGVADVRWRGP